MTTDKVEEEEEEKVFSSFSFEQNNTTLIVFAVKLAKTTISEDRQSLNIV